MELQNVTSFYSLHAENYSENIKAVRPIIHRELAYVAPRSHKLRRIIRDAARTR